MTIIAIGMCSAAFGFTINLPVSDKGIQPLPDNSGGQARLFVGHYDLLLENIVTFRVMPRITRADGSVVQLLDVTGDKGTVSRGPAKEIKVWVDAATTGGISVVLVVQPLQRGPTVAAEQAAPVSGSSPPSASPAAPAPVGPAPATAPTTPMQTPPTPAAAHAVPVQAQAAPAAIPGTPQATGPIQTPPSPVTPMVQPATTTPVHSQPSSSASQRPSAADATQGQAISAQAEPSTATVSTTISSPPQQPAMPNVAAPLPTTPAPNAPDASPTAASTQSTTVVPAPSASVAANVATKVETPRLVSAVPPPRQNLMADMVQIEGRDLEWSELGRNRKAKNDKPVRRRCSNFRIDRTEVTNQQYAEFLSASAANARFYDPRMDIVALDSTHFRAVAGKENFPVTFIDWLGAYTFASWAGKSLPTEDEWMLAALGSRRLQPSAVVYPWGDQVPDSTRANCVSSRMAPSVSRVASFPAGATPTQLSDMGGNVAEWTLTEGKIVLSDGKDDSWIIVKGGSFLDAGSQLSLTKRSLRKRDERLGSLGFRCIVREGASQ